VADVVGEYSKLAEVGWHRGVAVTGLAVDSVIALIGRGCQQYTTILLASRTPC
jgi:hypothetical protein